MLLFDEEGPSDIHAVDRMLACEAEIAIAAAMMQPEGAAHIAPGAPVCSGHQSQGHGPAASAGAFEPPIARTQARALAQLIRAPATASTEPPAVAALPVISASPQFTKPRLAKQPTDLSSGGLPVAASAALPTIAGHKPRLGPRAQSAATLSEHARAPAQLRLTAMLNRVAQLSVQALALTNLPLRLVPASMRPMANLIAISLALWVPAVWAVAPMMAARESWRTAPQGSIPAHDESSLKAEGHAPAGTKTAGRDQP